MSEIEVQTLRAWLADGDELAVIDIRSPQDVGDGSPLVVANVPAERLAADLARFVPRTSVRTVLVDDGGGQAQARAAELVGAGWREVVALRGGIAAWTAQPDGDRPTFAQPGATFAAAIRAEHGTPVTTAEELQRLRAEDSDVVVIDTRTVPEFAEGHVPGAVGVPGAELLRRFAGLVPSPDTRVVVSCAGLPRAIIGAQTLIDAGVPNPVSFLYDGTQAWTRSGADLEAGESPLPAVDKRSRADAAARVSAIAADDDTPRIDVETAAAWAADPTRTTYLLDVRTPEEYAAGHLPGSVSAEGGQLLAAAHRTIAVRGARVVLVDDLVGARAAVVAHWLRRRGFELASVRHDFAGPSASV